MWKRGKSWKESSEPWLQFFGDSEETGGPEDDKFFADGERETEPDKTVWDANPVEGNKTRERKLHSRNVWIKRQQNHLLQTRKVFITRQDTWIVGESNGNTCTVWYGLIHKRWCRRRRPGQDWRWNRSWRGSRSTSLVVPSGGSWLCVRIVCVIEGETNRVIRRVANWYWKRKRRDSGHERKQREEGNKTTNSLLL